MAHESSQKFSILGRRLRERREALDLAQEKLGVAIGLDESSARARISRYELGVSEPPLATARLLATALQVPLPYLYCEDEDVAQLLLALHALGNKQRKDRVGRLLAELRHQLAG
ncbi:Transcriptional regulator, XRE family [Sterolibacterium denitrificans]|uniref:Transcriptional regulator, XRE family n=1 Tax=Sterolibacterium denitrificans TaxID=157592 RepID=A0A7Z7MWN6_9PROT|nr:helix-turn-helix transcriptional regulator [Sterolibacterium denitrificans]SMB31543.1 Transcriptional regulator, XRE family [Sterolibacterium denitrificans]